MGVFCLFLTSQTRSRGWTNSLHGISLRNNPACPGDSGLIYGTVLRLGLQISSTVSTAFIPEFSSGHHRSWGEQTMGAVRGTLSGKDFLGTDQAGGPRMMVPSTESSRTSLPTWHFLKQPTQLHWTMSHTTYNPPVYSVQLTGF